VVAAASAAAYVSDKVQKYVKTVGTAMVGSFLIAKGVGFYAENFPKLFD
jgi:hypothetical protein